MLKKFLKRTMDFKKSMLVFKAAVLIVVFIFVGNLIAWQIGITDQLSKMFYWPNKGQVAGEFEVRAAQAANGCTLYVATNGSDSNSGRSLSAAFQTIQKAADTARAGDVVCVKAGIYYEMVTPKNSGTSGNWIRYLAYPGDEKKTIIDGSKASMPRRDYGIFDIRGKSYIEVSDFKIQNAHNPGPAIGINIIEGSKHIVIRNNYVYNTTYNGIGSWGYKEYRVITDEYANEDIIIEGNEIERALSDASSGECITISNTKNFVVKNNYVHDVGYSGHQGGGEGIDTRDGSAYGEVSYNHIHDVRRIGIYADSFDGYTHDIKYFGNIIHSVSAGIMLGTELGSLIEDLTFYNNILYNNVSGFAIGGLNLEIPGITPQLPAPIKNIKIINNTFYNNEREGIVSWNSDATNIVVRNNIFSNKKANCQICSIANATIDHNLIDGPGGVRGADYIEGDPLFVDPSNLNFHLSLNSPAIDKGSSVGAPGNDYDNNPRPQGAGYDIGAYEYGAGGSPSPSCTCSSWQNQGCGQGGCVTNQMLQTRSCNPSGCAGESQCVADASCDNNNNGGAISSCWDPVKGHCYPRVGTLQWGGARPEWYAKFDLVVTWQNDQLARKVKELNPHTYILPTNDWNFGGDFRGSLPDEWVLHRSDGSLYGNTIGDLMADPTQYALNVNGKKYNQALPESLAKKDLSIYDGIATDGIWADLFGATDVDIDRNGINDITEHGTGWIGNQYRNGWKTLLANLRNLIGNDKLIFLNYGHGDMTIGTPNYNGRFFEYWTRSEAAWEAFRQGVEGINANTGPDISMIGVKIGERAIDLEKGGSSKDTPRYIDFVRYGLASAAVAGTYIMADDWPEHYWANWVDEMDLNLGYPTGPAQKIEKIGGNSVCYEMWEKNVCPWVRFFDYGAVIVNPTRNILTIKDSDLKQFQGYNGLYYRFKGGQDPEVNNGQMFNQVTLTPYQVYAHNSENVAGIMGDGVVLVKEPTTMVSEIIIDTAYGPTSVSQRQAQLNDNWQEAADYYHSGNPNPEIDNPYWTTGPRWAADNLAERYHYTNSNNASAIFAPQINIAGEYEVFEWHGWHGKDQDDYQEASNVRYTINYTGGTTTGTIDQTTNYGQWNSLGKYTFNKGTSNNVTISSQGANGLVIADAVKFVYQVNFGNIKGVREVRASRYLTADFNCDNQVNIQDFGILLSHWQKQGQDLMNYQHSNCKEKRPIEIAPMNNSCALTSTNPTIDAVDIGMLLSCWGTPKDDGGSCCWK